MSESAPSFHASATSGAPSFNQQNNYYFYTPENGTEEALAGVNGKRSSIIGGGNDNSGLKNELDEKEYAQQREEYIKLRGQQVQKSLSLNWAFGLHRDYRSVIHNLSYSLSHQDNVASLAVHQKHSRNNTQENQKKLIQNAASHRAVFYPLAHIGVLYDSTRNEQRHLLGHKYPIVTSCSCDDTLRRRYIATVDEGDKHVRDKIYAKKQLSKSTLDELDDNEEDDARMIVNPREAQKLEEDDGSLLIVWDTSAALPITTIPVGQYGGAVACAMSPDGLFIATLNRRTPQEIMVWGWTTSRSGEVTVPEYVRRIPAQDEQTCIRFSLDNPYLICTNGLRRVMFWCWYEKKLKYYSPPILQKKFNASASTKGNSVGGAGSKGGKDGTAQGSISGTQTKKNNRTGPIIGQFTQTIFVPGTSMACSGTVDGDVILWDVQPRDRVAKEQDKTMVKMVRVHNGGVTCLTAANGYVVSGGMDGTVKFLDSKLRLVAWFEEIQGGPIISISFDKTMGSVHETVANQLMTKKQKAAAALLEEDPLTTVKRKAENNATLSGTNAASEFSTSDFMVSTANAMIIDVPAKSFHTGDPELLRGKLIVQGQDHAIRCLAAHPSLPRLAIAGLSGGLHLWDYEQRRVVLLSLFRQLFLNSMAFDPTGKFLVVGFTNGSMKILDANTLEERQTFPSFSAAKKKNKNLSGTNGNGAAVDNDTAVYVSSAKLAPDCVAKIAFSDNGRLMATADVSGCVALYEYACHTNNRPNRPRDEAAPVTFHKWDYIGRHKTHRAAVTGLQFCHDTSTGEAIRLLSMGEDKRLIEYNLVESDAESGLLLRTAHKITQGAVPTGFLWMKEGTLLDSLSYPRDVPGYMLDPDGNDMNYANTSNPVSWDLDYILIATNEYKLGVYLSDWCRQCIKTVGSPTFGGPIRHLAMIKPMARPPSRQKEANVVTGENGENDLETDHSTNSSNEFIRDYKDEGEPCLAYATKEKVIGLMQLPLKGDPCASMGLLAHPGAISAMVISYDGKYIFTAGDEDHAVFQWKVYGQHILPTEEEENNAHGNRSSSEVAKTTSRWSDSEVPLDHLMATIEGGVTGELMKEIVDYFYYAQIRSQGEETTAKRELLGAIRFAQLPNLFRALGYYPSELAIGHLTYEVANLYGPKDESLANMDMDIILLNFKNFMRLFVNYRPVFGISRQDIERAFLAIGANPQNGEIARDQFFDLLSTRGEPLTASEINAALRSLLGEGVRVDMLEDQISAQTFAENLLGFEDYNEGGEHEAEAEALDDGSEMDESEI